MSLWYTAGVSRPVLIGIAGGTGSGKTTISRELKAAIPDGRCVTIEHDSYYRDQSNLSHKERAAINYDHPDALETELLGVHLARLRAGDPVDVPVYDFISHTRSAQTQRLWPAPIIIVEGILVLAEAAIREQLDIKIFVDTAADIRLMRRIRRDIEQRGRSFASIRKQFYETVRPMHLEFVEPSKRFADIIIPEGGRNRIAIDILLGRLGEIAVGGASDPE